MEVIADTQEWAKRNFGSTNLGNRKRTRRLTAAAAKIAAQPEKSFTQTFDWNELRGFYRLCDQKTATTPAVLGPHWQQTRQEMGRHPLALILHDTTELDYTAHPALHGTGPIGNGNGQGFLQHNSLAVLPKSRQVLGLSYQQLRTRKPAPKGESSYQRKRRERETAMWLEGIRASGPPPESSCWVDVGDRGCDLYEAMTAALEVKHHFLFRAMSNRIVFVSPEHDRQAYQLDYARSLPSQGNDQVDIPRRGGRPARSASVCLAAAPVWIPAATGTPQRWSQPIIPAWVIRIWEPQPPPDVEPLEWILLCSLPTVTLEEMKERRDWYGNRWLIEVYHDVEKNGCREEERRFETAERMETCLAILSAVAVRVLQLRCALDNQPEAPAEEVGTQAEIQLVRTFFKHRGRCFTVRDFVRGVAKLGGFLGRKHDGKPGVRALWRGYQRLQDMLVGFHLRTSKVPGRLETG